MIEDVLKRVAGILGAIPGVISFDRLEDAEKRKVVELERRHESGLFLPVRNLGVSLMMARNTCFVLLKTGEFRPPKTPSLYMVEEVEPFEAGYREVGPPESDHSLTVEGKRYTIVGEEVTGGLEKYTEPIIPLEGSFIMFPRRRSGPRVPCFFLLPPLPFPELEKVSGELGLRGIISISPSLVSDGYLRETFGFSPLNSLATVLVGFDLIAP